MTDDTQDLVGLLTRGTRGLGIQPAGNQVDSLLRYAVALHDANVESHLTPITDLTQVVRVLVVSALSLALALPPGAGSHPWHLVDVGSGAGIPGIPLKILYPHWAVTLLEPSEAKSRFLREAVRNLELTQVDVRTARAGDPGLHLEADLCTARGVAPVATLMEWCRPLVRPGGLLIFPRDLRPRREVWTGTRWVDRSHLSPVSLGSELRDARARQTGLGLRLTRVLQVPSAAGLGSGRRIVVLERVE